MAVSSPLKKTPKTAHPLSVKVAMTFNRETPNTVRYDADDAENADVTALYIMKSAFDGAVPPRQITVLVNAR